MSEFISYFEKTPEHGALKVFAGLFQKGEAVRRCLAGSSAAPRGENNETSSATIFSTEKALGTSLKAFG